MHRFVLSLVAAAATSVAGLREVRIPVVDGSEGEVDSNGASAHQPVGGSWLTQLAGFQ
jgi:hypothetical protein